MTCSGKTFLGYVMLAVHIASWTASALSVQALQMAVPEFQLSALRYIGCILVSIIFIYIRKPSIHLSQEHYAYIIAMSIASVSFNVCYFSAVSLLPLTNASALTMSLRMIFFTLIMKVKFQEQLDKILIISIVGCSTGMLFIAQPWFEFTDGFTPGFLTPKTEIVQFNHSISSSTNISYSMEHNHTSDKKVIYQTLLLGYLLSILAAVAEAIYMMVASVYLKLVNPAVQCFASACISLPMSMLISFYVEQPIVISGTMDIFLVSTHVVASGVTLTAGTASLLLLNPIVAAIVENVDCITYIIPQYTFMGHYLQGRKNILEVFGCILMAAFAGLSSLSSCGYYHEDLS